MQFGRMGRGFGGRSAEAVPNWVLRSSGIPPALDINYANDLAYVLNLGAVPVASIHTAVNANGTYINSSGVNSSPGPNTLRYGDLGALCEEARTQQITNATFSGAVAGTPGTLPTTWAVETAVNLTTNVVGTGTENGFAYIDLQIVGTPNGTGNYQFRFGFGATASSGQRWVASGYMRKSAGSATNVGNVVVEVREDGGSFNGATSSALDLASSSLQRLSVARTWVTTDNAQWLFLVGVTNGQAIDITLRLAGPQLEECGSNTAWTMPTSFISSSAGTVTRTIDNVSLTSAAVTASGMSLGPGTLYVAWSSAAGPVSASAFLACLRVDDSNRINVRGNNGSNKVRSAVTTSGSLVAALDTTNSIVVSTAYKAAFAYDTNDFSAAYTTSLQSGTVTDAAGAIPTGAFTAFIGSNEGSTSPANSLITRIAWFPLRLADAALTALVT